MIGGGEGGIVDHDPPILPKQYKISRSLQFCRHLASFTDWLIRRICKLVIYIDFWTQNYTPCVDLPHIPPPLFLLAMINYSLFFG